MADKREIDSLREQVLVAHKLAARKVQRNESKGVKLAGSKYDPRRDTSKLQRYNKPQLESYLSQLNTFRDRSTQFVPDMRGNPVSGAEWREYKQLEGKLNAQRARRFKQFKDIVSYTTNGKPVTLAQELAVRTPDHPTSGNPATKNPNIKTKRTPRGITSKRSLDRMKKEVAGRLGKSGVDKELKDARKQFRQMMKPIGDKKFTKDVLELNDKQFTALWFYKGFADALALGYDNAQKMAGAKKKSWYKQVFDDQLSEARDLLVWAKHEVLGG